MPCFLRSLQGKSSLDNLRFIANFTADQTSQMAKITGLRSLTFDSATWNVVDMLPTWSADLGNSLTSLTLSVFQTLFSLEYHVLTP